MCHNRWAVIGFHQPGSCQPHYALTEAWISRKEQQRVWIFTQHPFRGQLTDLSGHILAFAVDRIQFLSQTASFSHIICNQQLKRYTRRFQPPCSIQARSQLEAEVARITFTKINPGNLRQRIEPLARCLADLRQALAHEHPVLALERRQVHHGAQSHQIHPILRIQARYRIFAR